MSNKIEGSNVFVTPDSMEDLMSRLESYTGSEKAVAMVAAMMAWNLACKIVNTTSDAEEDKS